MSAINCSNSKEGSINQASVHCDLCTLLLCSWCVKGKEGKDYCGLCYADLFSKEAEENPHDIIARETKEKLGDIVKIKRDGKQQDAVIFPNKQKVLLRLGIGQFGPGNQQEFESYFYQIKEYMERSRRLNFTSTSAVLESMFDKKIEKKMKIEVPADPLAAKEPILTKDRLKKVLDYFHMHNDWENNRKEWLRNDLALNMKESEPVALAVKELQTAIIAADGPGRNSYRTAVKEIIRSNERQLLIDDEDDDGGITQEHIHRTIRRIEREVRRGERGQGERRPMGAGGFLDEGITGTNVWRVARGTTAAGDSLPVPEDTPRQAQPDADIVEAASYRMGTSEDEEETG